MARGQRKPASDSTHQLTLDGQTPDTSALPVPMIAGTELLNATGMAMYESLFRSDPARWSPGDMQMMVNCAHVTQELHAAKMIATMTPTIVQATNGVRMRAPEHTLVADLEKRQSDLLRNLGCRSRDGAKPAPATPKTTPAADGENIVTFEDFLAAIPDE